MGLISTSVEICNPHNGVKLEMLDLLLDIGAAFTALLFQNLIVERNGTSVPCGAGNARDQ